MLRHFMAFTGYYKVSKVRIGLEWILSRLHKGFVRDSWRLHAVVVKRHIDKASRKKIAQLYKARVIHVKRART